MSTPAEDDITDDLTVDGSDLLAELRAAHGRQVGLDPDELTIDGAALLEEIKADHQMQVDVADASDLPAPAHAEAAPALPQHPRMRSDAPVGSPAVASTQAPAQPPTSSAGSSGGAVIATASAPAMSETTLGRWSPPPTLPESDAVVEPRAGKANRVQLLVIAAVVVVALGLGGWAMRGVFASPSTDDVDTSENTSDAESSSDLSGERYLRGFGG